MKKKIFSDKIKYLFEHLNLNQKEFVKLFWNGEKKRWNTRVKTVNNWLHNDIKQPKGFQLDSYRISTSLTIENGEPAFSKESFTMDSFEDFTIQVDRYLRYQAIPKDEFEYKYIYYYDSYLKKVTFVELKTIKKVHNHKYMIKLCLSKEYDERGTNSYLGELEIDRNYYHISAKNSFEILSFYFILNLGFKDDDSIYGLRLGKAYSDGLPLSAKNLLTKQLLNKQEERELYLNINETEELKSKEAFYDIYSSSIHNHINAFHSKISNLATYNSNVREILNDKLCENIYYNIMSKEFYAFSEVSSHVKHKNSFYIHNIRRASKVFLQSVACRKEPCYVVSPLIDNLSLLKEHDSKASQALKLNIDLAKDGLKIYRIFVIDKNFKLTAYVKRSIEKLIESGIDIRIIRKKHIESIVETSYDFIYSQTKDIAIFRKPSDRFCIYHVTNDKHTLNHIDIDYLKIKAKSYTFEEFLKNKHLIDYTVLNRLKGEFFHYSYGSKEGKEDGKLHFWNNRKIEISKENKVKYLQDDKVIAVGEISIEENQSYIHMLEINRKNSISMRFDNIDTDYEIFRVIKIGKQYIREKDMVSIGVFSRKKLDDKTAQELIGDEEKSIFNISSSVKENIDSYYAKRGYRL